MGSLRRFWCALLAVILVGIAPARASITGSISGIVADSSGSVIADATVTATERQTGVKTVIKTDGQGFYNFPSLAIGTYDVDIEQSGFKGFRKTGMVIDANSAIKLDVVLQVGATTEKMEITSDAVTIDTQSTQNGDVITGTKMTTVPLNGRAYTDLLSLQPGVVPTAYGSQAPGVNDRAPSGGLNSGNVSVNGQREAANGFMVNGANVTEGKNNGASVIPNLDSIAEFRIITNNFDSEYGNYSGGQINVATKSGANKFHGSAFEFNRNTDFKARNFFDPPDQNGDYKRNQFGGTIGGPIKHDKMFFFADYQGTRQIVGSTVNTVVPTAAERQGNVLNRLVSAGGTAAVSSDNWAGILQDRLQASNPGQAVAAGEPYWFDGCNSTNPSGGCVFPTGVIPQSAWSPAAAPLLQYIPTGDATSGALVTSAFPDRLRDDKGSARVDLNTRFGMISGYYFLDDFNLNSAYPNGGANVPGFNGLSLGRAQLINIGDTKSFGSTAVNEFHISYTRNAENLFSPQGGLGASLSSLGFTTPASPGGVFNGGLAPIQSNLEGVPNISFNTFSIGIPSDTVSQFNNTYQVQDTFSKVIGRHSLKFGAQFKYDQINERNFYGENGSFGFFGGETGSDFADFLLGAPDSFIQASKQILDSRTKYTGLFAQDSWRVTSNLTFNYGLRWEVSQPWYDTQNKIETIIPGQQSVLFPGAPTGWLVAGDPGVPSTLAPTKYDAFAPRLGLAYSPNKSEGWLSKITGGPGKMTIRAGYGIFYTAVEDLSQFLEVGDAPFGLFYVSPAPPQLEAPFLNRDGTNQGQRFPFQFPPTNVSASNPDTSFNWASVEPISSGFVFWNKNRQPYSEHFELSIERQIGSNTLLDVAYVGNQGHKLVSSVEANPASASLCQQLNALGATPECGPFGENTIYTLPAGVNLPAGLFPGPVVGGQATTYGTRTVLDPAAFGSNPYIKEIANSAYNSLQISLKHNSKYGEFLAGYTYSKCLDNSSGLQDTTNPFDPQLSRSLCAFDVTHNFVISYSALLPFDRLPHLDHGVAKQIVGGWTLSGITTFASGLPVSLGEGDDNSLTGAVGVDLPKITGAGTVYSDQDPRHYGSTYLNVGHFAPEDIGTIGDANRRFFHGPGLNNFDMALLKNIRFTEAMGLELRFEAFNIFNHAQFSNPNGDINAGAPDFQTDPSTGKLVNQGGTFGLVLSAHDPRILQFALKFHF